MNHDQSSVDMGCILIMSSKKVGSHDWFVPLNAPPFVFVGTMKSTLKDVH